jgi:hypothetical protein
MKLDLVTAAVAANPVWLDTTEGLRFLVGGVTIDSAAIEADYGTGKKIVASGTPITKSGDKWVPSFDEYGTPTAILWETLDVTDGDAHGSALDHGRVNEAAMPVVVDAVSKAALASVGITFKS